MNCSQNFDAFFSSQLNPEQQQAVSHAQGPLLVIAGAGSGKTRVITARIAYLLIKQQVSDDQILALTFTNKAAREMKERVQQFIQTPIKTFIGTFHGYCLQLLKQYAAYLSIPHFSILDTDDQHALLTTIIKRAGLERRLSAKGLAYQLSIYKNTDEKSIFTDQQLTEIFVRYEQEKRASNCFDFDDLLLEVLTLLKKKPELIRAHRARIRHILVDEYQDTNSTQHNLLSLFTLEKKKLVIDSVCAVGDEDQSIYSWRGATIENMLKFKNDFSGTLVIKIEQNYRSEQPILDVANTVINHNTQRTHKKLWSTKKSSDRVRIIECFSNYQEGAIITHLAKILRTSEKRYSKGVLYRAHYQSRAIEEALISHSISYTIVGGIQFYERKEIKDLLAYLKLIINSHDKIAFFRIVNYPLRSLGEAFQKQFYAYWAEQPFLPFHECAEQLIQKNMVTGNKKEHLVAFCNLIRSIDPTSTPHEALQKIIHKTNYTHYLLHAFDRTEADAKIENIKELLRACYQHEQRGLKSIEQFLHEIALLQQHDQSSDHEPEVILMTLHSAKGLEFDCVVLCGLEENVFPHSRSVYDSHALEEERRLFYVGITRAREYLLLSYAQHRSSFGATTDQRPSRFLHEIPHHFVKHHQGTQWYDTHIIDFFSQWFGLSKQEDQVITFGGAQAIKKSSKKIAATTQPNQIFKLNTPVNHEIFGIGLIKKIEQKSGKMFITVSFRMGTKKVESSFLKPV